MGKIEASFYEAICAWNERKTFRNFCRLYDVGFDTGAFFGFRIWRIIRNTLIGRYRDIETKVKSGEFLLK